MLGEDPEVCIMTCARFGSIASFKSEVIKKTLRNRSNHISDLFTTQNDLIGNYFLFNIIDVEKS